MRTKRTTALLAAAATALTTGSAASAQQAAAIDLDKAQAKAAATISKMTADEKVVLTHGMMPLPLGGPAPEMPADAIPGVGYIHAIKRLGTPALKETDASLGSFICVNLAPGTARSVSVTIEQRAFADWHDGGWAMPAGEYVSALGKSAENLGPSIKIDFPAKH